MHLRPYETSHPYPNSLILMGAVGFRDSGQDAMSSEVRNLLFGPVTRNHTASGVFDSRLFMSSTGTIQRRSVVVLAGSIVL